ncbi:hypothetical protein [Photobacterium nomapromontoriensis]|uniref:hypothetical protein n=1 Tax=Photobacterium nomapromontoriensis TaxID=2910237 RepID=UPI003D0C3DA6
MSVHDIALHDEAIIINEQKFQRNKKNTKPLKTQGGKLKRLLSLKSSLRCKLHIEGDEDEKQLIRTRLSHVQGRIERLTSSPVITEHAILRYLERVKGINISEIEREILNDSTLAMINTYGIGVAKIPHPGGCRLVIEDKTVITVEA